MTKAERARAVAWRLKILRHAQGERRQVARTCRHFGISRTMFYRWKRRYEAHGEAGLADRSRAPQRSPRATPDAVVIKALYCVSSITSAPAGSPKVHWIVASVGDGGRSGNLMQRWTWAVRRGIPTKAGLPAKILAWMGTSA